MLATYKISFDKLFNSLEFFDVGSTHLLDGQLVLLHQHLLERPELELLDVPQLAGAIEEVSRVSALQNDQRTSALSCFCWKGEVWHVDMCATASCTGTPGHLLPAIKRHCVSR